MCSRQHSIPIPLMQCTEITAGLNQDMSSFKLDHALKGLEIALY